MKKLLHLAVLLGVFTGATLSLPAQTAEPPASQTYQPLSDQDLDQLLGPIALYPDPLIAEILPAATFPAQIVLADRYLQGGGDPNQIDQQSWDPSVQAVAHYPNVLQWLDNNLNWTTELGEAFLNQQPDVMNSIQRLRATAQNMGNLQSTPQQDVIDDGADIEIVPADPDVIYVPVYEPDQVYVDSGGPFITFGLGCAIGTWLNCDFDWGHHHLIVWGHGHPRPTNWWHESGGQREAGFAGHTTVWHPMNHPGAGAGHPVDRGYNNLIVNNRPVARPTPVRDAPVNDNYQNNVRVGPVIGRPGPAPAPVQRFEPETRPPEASSGAFIGSESSQAVRDFSSRGQESMGNSRSEPAPAPRSEPSSGGGGGGSHGGGGGGGGGKR